MAAPLRRIRASAGSGKTYELVSRFLALLAASRQEFSRGAACSLQQDDAPAQRCAWQEILAITFTNQAAAELRERIVGRLKAIALGLRAGQTEEDAPLSPPIAAAWIEVLLRRFSLLNVRTIDSLLHQIVRMAALELDLPPDFEPVFDEQESLMPLWDNLMELSRTDQDVRRLLDRACQELIHNPQDFKGFLAGKDLCDTTLRLAMTLSLDTFSRLADAQTVIKELAALCEAVRCHAGKLQALCVREQLALSKYAAKALQDCLALPDNAAAPSSKLLGYPLLDDWLLKASKGKASPQAISSHARLVEAVAALAGRGSILRSGLRTAPLIRLAMVLAGALPDELQREGKIPQRLMPAYAIKALRSEYGVPMTLCRMGTRLSHFLIDEFQDTSREQWDALRPLVLEALAHGGTLTFVGDVKQAIYGWRGGDSLLFDEVGEDPDLCAMGALTEKELPINRRSLENIVHYNNTVFSRLEDPATARAILQTLLPAETPECVLEEQTRLLSKAFSGTRQRVWGQAGGLVRIDELYGDTTAELNEAIHDAVVERIQEITARHPCGDIAILVRTTEEANLVADWLLSEHFPVVTENSFRLGEHPLVGELVALLTFLDTPDDNNTFWQLATASFLTTPASPSFEQLQDWLADVAADDTPLWRLFQRDFPEAWEAGFANLFQQAGLLGVYDTVSEALHHFDVWRRFPAAATFASRFLEILHQAENRGMASAPAFLDYWQSHGNEEKAPMPAQIDAIRIMTMHKSKGLQFPVVLAPWLNLTPQPSSTPHPYDLGDGSTLFAPLTAAWGAPYYTDLGASAREEMHLLYVTWTRPQEELHVFITSTRRNASSAEAMQRLLGDTPRTSGTPQAPASAPASAVSARKEPSVSALPSEDTPPTPWLPELKIFRNPLEIFAEDDIPRSRGTLVHRCLERLYPGDDTESSIRRAVTLGMRNFPAPIPHPEQAAADLTGMLRWLLSLPEAVHWLRHGTTECSILDEQGRLFRADLVVNDGQSVVIVDYKTGEPSPAHESQLRRYMRLFADAQPLPVSGALIYLDQRRVFRYEANGKRHRG
ncbi:MAG TPA: UvrD-helicase domain-containing protein [Candidatus Avidesulfovibrio excrementigallinarum]|nr:UvrD-helicase domain-containing protein [Candidatus Avidesulfovibrio excrementigallinarum]